MSSSREHTLQCAGQSFPPGHLPPHGRLPAALPVVYVLLVRLPADGVETFQRYEAQVLPLLANHNGRLERRLRSPDGRVEVHLVSFPSVEDFHSYRDDPRRAELQPLLERSGAQADLYELYDVL